MENLSNMSSRFGIYEEEKRKINKNRILNKENITIQNISELEKYIISIIYRFKVITLDQISKIIEIEGKKYKNYIIEENIQKLLNSNIIQSEQVYNTKKENEEFIFYYILNNFLIGNEKTIENYRNKSLIEIKKRLVGNEIIISFLLKLNHDIFDFKTDTKLVSKRFSKLFNVDGANIIIEKENKKYNILYEVVRKEKDWKEKIVNKLKLYKSFYDELITTSKSLPIFPQLILVCEDDKHVKELIEEIIKEKCIISKLRLYISTDYMIKNDILNSIIEIKIDEKNNRYEKIYKKIKIE